MDFNPRSHERSDQTGDERLYMASAFQSTLPREERLKPEETKVKRTGFQSTLPREERRVLVQLIYHLHGISIHAPTRGATGCAYSGMPIAHDFNPRSHERSDAWSKKWRRSIEISIHAPTRGATFFHWSGHTYT